MTFAITGVRVWDGISPARSSAPMTIHVEDGRIIAVEPAAGVGSRAKVFRYNDATVLPGLIDAHVHMSIDPRRGVAAQAEIPASERWQAMVERAEAMVRVGITTARDLGGGEWLELELRDRIAAGELPGPRLLCVGQPLTAPAGHCHFWGGEARSHDEVRAVIERQIARGVDWIKVMVTGGVATKGTKPSQTQFDDATLAHAVAEARRHGRAVAAHCHGTAGIGQAARNGVRTIEHCSFSGSEGFGSDLDAGVVAAIADAEAWVSPTVNAGWGRLIEKDGKPSVFFERMSAAHRALRDAGVPFIASTDAGIPGVEHHRLADGLIAFQRYADLAPVDVLRAATSESARALGLGEETGSLREGLAADLMVVAGDPLRDLHTLRRPLAVFARGIPIEARPVDEAGPRPPEQAPPR